MSSRTLGRIPLAGNRFVQAAQARHLQARRGADQLRNLRAKRLAALLSRRQDRCFTAPIDGECSRSRFAPLAAPGCQGRSIIASDLHRRDRTSRIACLQRKRSRSTTRGAIAPPLTCPFALSADAADDGTGARNKKTASRRPFELMALSWEVELRGFEPSPGPLACHTRTARRASSPAVAWRGSDLRR